MAGTDRVRLSVFKGKKARLNRIVFQVLARHGPLTIPEIRRRVRALRGFRYTKYSVINRRIRALTEEGYLQIVGYKKPQKAPILSPVYQLTARAYLAMLLDQMDLDRFLREADEATTLTALGALIT